MVTFFSNTERMRSTLKPHVQTLKVKWLSRAHRAFVVPLLLVVLLGIARTMWEPVVLQWGLQPKVVFVVAGAAFLAVVAWMNYAQRKARRVLKLHSGLACTRCLYPLDRISEGRCPECGHPFAIDTTRAAWSNAGMWSYSQLHTADNPITYEPPRR